MHRRAASPGRDGAMFLVVLGPRVVLVSPYLRVYGLRMFRVVQERRPDALKSQRSILSRSILVWMCGIAGLMRTHDLVLSGDDLNLHSASEDEESAEVDDEVSDAGTNKDSDTEEPAVSRTLTMFSKSKEATPDAGGVAPVVDDSETESESEVEPVARTLKRKSPSPQAVPPAKRQQIRPVEGML